MQFLRRWRSSSRLVAAEGVAIVAVQRLGQPRAVRPAVRRPRRVARTHRPMTRLAAALRSVALLCAWWLLLVTLAYRVRERSTHPERGPRVRVGTPSAIRRTVDRALAASIVVGAVTTPFGARCRRPHARTPPPPSRVIVDVRDGREPRLAPRRHRATAATSLGSCVEPPAATVLPHRSSRRSIRCRRRRRRAATTCGISRPPPSRASPDVRAPTSATTRSRRYWSVVCDANRATVRSGDVNLIYPGELWCLPPVP